MPVQAQTVVYQENFENTTNETATGAQGYSVVGDSYAGTTPPGQTYTASADWLNGNFCNGVIVSANNATPVTWADNDGDCRPSSGVQSYNAIRTLARGMGTVFGLGDANHVVSAYTECPNGTCVTIGSGATNGVMFRTNLLIPVTANRFYTFSVDVGALNCGPTTGSAGDPQFQFQLINSALVATNIGGILNVCGPGRTVTTVTNLQTSPFPTTRDVYTRSLQATQAIKYTGTTLGVQLYNASGITLGNDAAFDNIRVLDVTPRISKTFSPATTAAGSTVQMVFTVNNTTDGLAKPGWDFTETLSAGLTLANTTVGGTCTNTANTAGTTATLSGAVAGGTTFTVNGSLPTGTSCTVILNVAVASTVTSPTLQNCPANFSSTNYVDPPTACATLNITRPVVLTKTWTNAISGNAVSLTISGTNVSAATAGSSTAPSTTTNATAQALLGSTVTLAEGFTAGNATDYTQTLVCTKNTGGADVPVTGTGLSRSITMPTDSAVTCTYNNTYRLTDLSITKTNTPASGALDQVADTVASGTLTTYTIVVRNSGAVTVTGAVLQDPAASRSGLTCTTPPVCTSSAATGCPATALTLAGLDSGAVLTAIPAGQTVTVTLTCTVQ